MLLNWACGRTIADDFVHLEHLKGTKWYLYSRIAQLEAGIFQYKDRDQFFEKKSDFPPESGLFRIILGVQIRGTPKSRNSAAPPAKHAEMAAIAQDLLETAVFGRKSWMYHRYHRYHFTICGHFHAEHDDIDSVGLLGVSDKPKCVCPTTRDRDVYQL